MLALTHRIHVVVVAFVVVVDSALRLTVLYVYLVMPMWCGVGRETISIVFERAQRSYSYIEYIYIYIWHMYHMRFAYIDRTSA